MKRGVYLLPNGLTLCGMFFGFFSILSSLRGDFVLAAWMILVANIFDGLDGWVARLTNTATRFGIELDSLSDLVAYGVAPSIMVFNWALHPFGRVGAAVAFLYMSCGALRLARYNVQMVSTEKKYFTGMPIPGAATILSTLVIFWYSQWDKVPAKNYGVLALTAVLSLLMISTLRFHGLKELDMKSRKPFLFLVLMMVFFIVVIVHPPIVLFSFAILYLFWGIGENIYLFYSYKRSDPIENVALQQENAAKHDARNKKESDYQ
jgi:CDP-diacylglycerol--serine O-phosphatidyltransferase